LSYTQTQFTKLSALDPGKQGLKLFMRPKSSVRAVLSALDPGKQGLKLDVLVCHFTGGFFFQRLIQENKD